MSFLVSALIPTRCRPERLRKTISSLRETAAHPERIQFCLRVDDDDVTTIEMLHSMVDDSNIEACIAPRVGYAHMGMMADDCVKLATGTWVFLIDDDCWLEGFGWDNQLAAINPEHNVAQCEFYHLGGSRYDSGSCGPVGMIVPNRSWEKYGNLRVAGVADDFFRDTMVDVAGFHVNLLKGIIYRHNRDNDQALVEHRKL